MATWKQPHDSPMSAIEELIERVDKAESDRDRLVGALRALVDAADAMSWATNSGTADAALADARAALEGL